MTSEEVRRLHEVEFNLPDGKKTRHEAEPEREKRIKALTGELHPIANRTARVDTNAHSGQLMLCVGIDNHV